MIRCRSGRAREDLERRRRAVRPVPPRCAARAADPPSACDDLRKALEWGWFGGWLVLFLLTGILGPGPAGAAQLVLRWNDNAGNEFGFKVDRKVGTNGGFVHIASPGSNANSYTDSGLTAAAIYCYRVRAFNAVGESTYSNEACAVAATFLDVRSSHWAWRQVEQLVAGGVTAGCGGASYCPDAVVTRDQIAVFLLRARYGPGYAPPPATGIFDDVSPGYWAAGWIEQLIDEGITAGCSASPLRYCPGSPVTRAEMAVFLLKAKYGPAYVPPAASGVFADVPTGHWAAGWIEQLARDGITGGCSSSPSRYCPGAPVTRAQMAVFLVNAFDP